MELPRIGNIYCKVFLRSDISRKIQSHGSGCLQLHIAQAGLSESALKCEFAIETSSVLLLHEVSAFTS